MPAFTKPTGRPPTLTRTIRRDANGRKVTVADAIVDAIRAGCFIEQAAAAHGVHKNALYEWQRIGARVNIRLLNNGARRSDFTPKELACAAFADAVSRAYAEATAIEVTTAAQLARGGLQHTVTTTKVSTTPGGQPKTETTTRVETLAPDSAMIRWRLSKREADTWGRERVELTGADGGPIEVLSLPEKRERVLASLAALEGRLAEPAELLPPDEAVG